MQYDIPFLKEYGYLYIQNFLSDNQYQLLLDGCKQLSRIESAREIPKVKDFQQKHGSSTIAFLNKEKLVPQLHAFIQSPVLQEISDAIFNQQSQHHMNLLQLSMGGKQQGIAWHRDTAFHFGAMQMMNVLMYPLGTDEERGGITVLPGSQKQKNAGIKDSFGYTEGQITLYPDKRDLLVVDGACYHCVSHSHSSKDRMSFNVRIRHVDADKDVSRYAEFTTGFVDYLPELNE